MKTHDNVLSRIRFLFIILVILLHACSHLTPLPHPSRKTKGVYHTVKKGETLWRICTTYKADLQEVAEINNIKNTSQIKAGDKIFIPGAAKSLRVLPPSQVKKKPKKTYPAKKKEQKIKHHAGIFHWPLKGTIITGFGIVQGMKHDGINIKTPAGTTIKASAGGKVVFASTLEGYGKTIILQHKDSYATVYANNQSNLVKNGNWVKQGHPIAKVGTSSKKSKVPYLHFQIRRYNRPRNPLFYLPK